MSCACIATTVSTYLHVEKCDVIHKTKVGLDIKYGNAVRRSPSHVWPVITWLLAVLLTTALTLWISRDFCGHSLGHWWSANYSQMLVSAWFSNSNLVVLAAFVAVVRKNVSVFFTVTVQNISVTCTKLWWRLEMQFQRYALGQNTDAKTRSSKRSALLPQGRNNRGDFYLYNCT